MTEIDIAVEKTKYQAELDGFIKQLGQLEQQRNTLVQAIHERQGIIAYLTNLNGVKDTSKGDKK